MLYNILNDRNSLDFNEYPVVSSVLNSLTQEEVAELLYLLSTMQKDKLYKGLVHGEYHSEKVLMYCFLIAKAKGYASPYRQILFDAAMYHDIGRVSNAEDTTHGMTAAFRIEEVIKGSKIYEEPCNLLLLRATMDAHSRPDHFEERAYVDEADLLNLLDENFELPAELEQYKEVYRVLAKTLKDADALDRKRFGDAGFESLNVSMLRDKESIDLVMFAEELNRLYYELMKLNYAEIDETNIPEAPCVHSVGFDFFKINSVLTHGILSQEEMKRRQLHIPRNFAGGNFDRWISVVDIRLLKLCATASQEFIERGVTFICQKVKMHEPCSAADMEDAIVTGKPWNKSNHADERYVKNRIAPENIIAVNVPNHYINKSILDTARTGDKEHDSWRMVYIYNSLDIKMIRQRVQYYKDKTQAPDDAPYWLTILEMLERYEKVLVDRDIYGRLGIVAKLEPILDEINTNIGKMLYAYYYKKIGSADKDITVLDIVTYELGLNYSIKYDFCQTSDGATFFLTNAPKSIGEKQI